MIVTVRPVLRSKPDWRVLYIRTGKEIIRAICAVEFIALTGKTPLRTITYLSHKYRNTRHGKIIIIFAILWLAYHLLFEPESTR